MTDREVGFFTPPAVLQLARPLAVAVLWTFAAILAGGVIVGLASLAAGGVTAIVGVFDGTVSITGAMLDTLMISAWIVAPVGMVLAVWTAAYGTTRQRSIPRVIVAAPFAVGIAVGLLLLGSSALVAAGLAIGWALAIPAASLTNVAARALPLLIVALAAPRLDDLSVGSAVVMLVASPVVAAVGVYLGNLPWALNPQASAEIDESRADR